MLKRFIIENQHADVAQLALQRKRYPILSDSDFRFCLQQIEGRQRTRDKLPTFATIDGWIYPPRLNLEQCSSERTARYKAELLSTINSKRSTSFHMALADRSRLCRDKNSQLSTLNLIDATGGYGVDTFFMSAEAGETHYFEQNADLAAIAEHNFHLAGKSIICHPVAFSVERFLSDFTEGISSDKASIWLPKPILLYIDPARRDSHGGKVFRLEDCTPNVIEIVQQLQQHCPDVRILLKLSPMLDLHQAIAQLGGTWDMHILSIAGEVKELLLLSHGTGTINTVALDDSGSHVLSFTADEERTAQAQYLSPFTFHHSPFTFIYEPDAAVLKAGAFRLLSARYGLLKADANTHLYLSDSAERFASIPLPGRLWQIVAVYARSKDVQRALARANVLTRNYVLPADALRKQLRLKDGGEDYIIGCRIAGKPLLLHCRRCE